MLPLKKPENKRTATEKSVRNCVFMFVIVYVALLTGLFLNSQINVVNAESDLVSAYLTANVNVVNTDKETIEEEVVEAEDAVVEDIEVEATDVELL